jgi:hypothetical protein
MERLQGKLARASNTTLLPVVGHFGVVATGRTEWYKR